MELALTEGYSHGNGMVAVVRGSKARNVRNCVLCHQSIPEVSIKPPRQRSHQRVNGHTGYVECVERWHRMCIITVPCRRARPKDALFSRPQRAFVYLKQQINMANAFVLLLYRGACWYLNTLSLLLCHYRIVSQHR